MQMLWEGVGMKIIKEKNMIFAGEKIILRLCKFNTKRYDSNKKIVSYKIIGYFKDKNNISELKKRLNKLK